MSRNWNTPEQAAIPFALLPQFHPGPVFAQDADFAYEEASFQNYLEKNPRLALLEVVKAVHDTNFPVPTKCTYDTKVHDPAHGDYFIVDEKHDDSENTTREDEP